MRRSPLRTPLVLLVLAGAACAGAEPDGEAAPADTAAAERTTPLKALAESQSLEIRTALSAMNRALLSFHVLNDRYPRDVAELESSETTAAELAGVRAASDSVSYASEGGGYRMVVHVRGGEPLTMEAPAPTLRPETP